MIGCEASGAGVPWSRLSCWSAACGFGKRRQSLWRKGDNSLTVAKARFLQAWLTQREIGLLVPKVMKKYQDQLTSAFEGDDGVVPIRVKALLQESEPAEDEHPRTLELARKEIARRERDEYDALEEAVPDLIRLERYERRAWSRQRRAIREFLNLKFARKLLPAPAVRA